MLGHYNPRDNPGDVAKKLGNRALEKGILLQKKGILAMNDGKK